MRSITTFFFSLTEHYAVFGEEIQTQNFNIYYVNEIIIQTQKYVYTTFRNWIKKLFSEENKPPRTLF